MRYHLKNDGTAGRCTARPGQCPKGDAIHGDDVEEVYEKLAEVMRDQLIPKAVTEKPGRPTAREIGTQGMMMSYSNPQIVKEQLEAIQRLGLTKDALETVEHYQPLLASALQAGRLDAIDFDKLYVEPQRYSYEGHQEGYGEDGTVYYSGTTKTWVAGMSYELQTVALNDLMDKLENGTLEGADVEAYRVALADTSDSQSSYLAFNYNPSRQPDGFFDRVRERFVAEGFEEVQTSPNSYSVRMPDFFWKGLTKDGRERVATHLFEAKYNAGRYRSLVDNVLRPNRGATNFADIVEKGLAHHPSLHGPVLKEGTITSRDTGAIDASQPLVRASYRLTDQGVEFTEAAKLFYSAEDRRKDLVKLDEIARTRIPGGR